MLFATSNSLNATVVILTVYSILLGTVSVFTGLTALEYPDLVLPGPQAGDPVFPYIQSDHFMRDRLLELHQWFNGSDITQIINAMQAGNLSPEQRGVLTVFLLKSSLVISYLQLLVERSLLTDEQ